MSGEFNSREVIGLVQKNEGNRTANIGKAPFYENTGRGSNKVDSWVVLSIFLWQYSRASFFGKFYYLHLLYTPGPSIFRSLKYH